MSRWQRYSSNNRPRFYHDEKDPSSNEWGGSKPSPTEECWTCESAPCPGRLAAIIQTPGRGWRRIVRGGQPGPWISRLPPKDPRKGTREEGSTGGGHREASVSSGGEQRVTRGSILYRGRDPPLVARCSTLSAALPFASPRIPVVWRRLAVPRGTPGPREGRHRAPAHPHAAAQIRWHAYKSRFPADKPATARRSAGGHRCAPPLGVCVCAREARLWLYNIVPLSA